MAHQLLKTSQVTLGQQYAEYFIESIDDLINLPQTPTPNCCLGSIAYTKEFDIYLLTSNGWELSG